MCTYITLILYKILIYIMPDRHCSFVSTKNTRKLSLSQPPNRYCILLLCIPHPLWPLATVVAVSSLKSPGVILMTS